MEVRCPRNIANNLAAVGLDVGRRVGVEHSTPTVLSQTDTDLIPAATYTRWR